METNMKATLCQHTVENAYMAYPEIRGAILYSDRGTQYTSELYRTTLAKYGIVQSMNSAGGRCMVVFLQWSSDRDTTILSSLQHSPWIPWVKCVTNIDNITANSQSFTS